ncbi:hypothetical protein MTO96_010984 [Rhipicephalus appendiculatus]
MFKSSVWSDALFSCDLEAELLVLGSLVGSTIAQPFGENEKSSEDGSNAERISACVGDSQDRKQLQQSSSASEPGEQAGKL